MSAIRVSKKKPLPPHHKPVPSQDTDAAVFDFAVELAGMKADSKGVKADLDALDLRLGGLESEMRRGFNALAENISRLTAPKGVPWQMISIMVVVGIALMSWANSYFGQSIASAQKESAAVAASQQMLSNRIDLVSQRGYEMNQLIGGYAKDTATTKEAIHENSLRLDAINVRIYEQGISKAKEDGVNQTTADYTRRELERHREELDIIRRSASLEGIPRHTHPQTPTP